MIKIKGKISIDNFRIYLVKSSGDLRPIKDELIYHWNYINSWLRNNTTQPAYSLFNTENICLIHLPKNIDTDIIDYKFCKEVDKIRIIGSNVESELRELKITQFSINNLTEDKELIYPVIEGILLSNYNFDKYITSDIKKSFWIKEIQVLKEDVSPQRISQLSSIINAVRFARDLVNEPPNILTATELSIKLKEMSKSAQLRCQILDKKKIEQLNMGGILAVNKGSIKEPTFTILEHNPERAINKQPIVIIGKGVVYDTGGLSLKPTPNSMDKMKSDMAGAAVAAAIMKVVAELELPIHIVALIPATDNRPGLDAYTPGDIITMHDGQSVEVLNTDAEGRLILADAIHYAKRYNPSMIQTIATLTGAAAAAIGPNAMVVMGNVKSNIISQLESCGYQTNEKVAVMPFWDEYADYLKTSVADMKNIGGSVAGAITAGKFLEKFTTYPFLHMDIAGVSFADKKNNYIPEGGTGFGIRMMSQFLINMCKK